MTNGNHKQGLMLACRHDVDMFTRDSIVLFSLKRAHVDWNWPISQEKYLKIDRSVKMRLHCLWELQAPSNGLLLPLKSVQINKLERNS